MMCEAYNSLKNQGFDIDSYTIVPLSNLPYVPRPYINVCSDMKNELVCYDGYYVGYYSITHKDYTYVLVKKDVEDVYGYIKSLVRLFKTKRCLQIYSYNKSHQYCQWVKIGKIPKAVPSSALYDEWIRFVDNYKQLSKTQSVCCNYVLYGEPGTGKSTFVSNIARLLGYDMYIVNEYDETCLSYYKKSVILFEELDKILNDNGDFTISDGLVTVMLQYLDGNLRPANSIIFITCNNIDRLRSNKVLSRPGRIDKFIKFGTIDVDTCKNVCDLYYGGCDYQVVWDVVDKKATVGMLSSYLKIASIEGIPFDTAVANINSGMAKYVNNDKRMYY